jgi:pimeloyl-ACP methyl ester carboxylesterase
MKLLVATLTLASILPFGSTETVRTVSLSGHEQKLRMYGPETGRPVILASGDGGWMHLAPHLATLLASRGYFVIGLDARSYLSSGSGAKQGLTTHAIASDYATLLSMFAAGDRRVILAGVSEGAGLSVVAGSDPNNQARIAGVMTFGLGERNELAWHWKDSLIYITKGVPSEPTFNATDFLPHLAPLPLAFIRATHDEFVPQAQSDQLIASASGPRRAWTIEASDHRFSDNLSELDRATTQAFDWIFATRH